MASKSPFPGMDPWLESSWGDVHTSLIACAREAIKPNLPPGLRVRMQQRVFVESSDIGPRGRYPDLHIVERAKPYPGVESAREQTSGGLATSPLRVRVLEDPVIQNFLEISDASGTVITVLEFLSPSNKVPGAGQKLYLDKQRELRGARVNLVEIDLARTGERVTLITPDRLSPKYQTPYYAVVSRGSEPDWAEVYPIPLREPLPPISIPLRHNDGDMTLRLQDLIEKTYDLGGYESTDYTKPPIPALVGPDAIWAAELLRTAGQL